MGRAPSDTKTKLIATATELIWSSSYNAVSVDEICAKAGVKKGSFYHFFPSKAHLALATMDGCMEETKIKYDDMFSPTRPPLQRFELMVEHIIEQQTEKYEQLGHVCGCPFATLGTEIAAQDDIIEKRINEICAKKSTYYESALRDLISEGIIPATTDTKRKADEIFAFIVGQLVMARIRNDLDALKKHLRPALFDMLGVTHSKYLTSRSMHTATGSQDRL